MDGQYYSLLLSPNMSLSVEGYLICVNVPICRSGYQEYYGRELEGFDGYQAFWNLEPNVKYKVFRPREEVLHPDTISSFEGKSVVDEHPTGDGNVIHIDNERYLNCGHIQNVREGPMFDGEVTLQGDIWIKDPTLKEKVRPTLNPDSSEAVRDVSCGYTLKLKRLLDGMLIMYHIRGNHVAVVVKGRAGSLIAIRDAVPQLAIMDSSPPEIKQRKVSTMSIREMIFGRGLKAYAADASPEELVSLSKELSAPKETPTPAPVAVAVDATPQPGKPAGNNVSPHRLAAHDALDRALDAMGDKEGMGKDAFGKPAVAKDLKAEVDSFLGDKEPKEEHAEDSVAELADAAADAHPKDCTCDTCKSAKDAAADEEHQAEKTAAEEKDHMHDGAKAEKQIDNHGKSVLGAANDSVRAYLKVTKPIVAAIANKPRSQRNQTEQIALDSYNTAVQSLNKSGNPYSALTTPKTPVGIPALVAVDSAAKTEADDVSRFYEGVPYRVGKQKHDEYLAQKGSK